MSENQLFVQFSCFNEESIWFKHIKNQSFWQLLTKKRDRYVGHNLRHKRQYHVYGRQYMRLEDQD